MSKKGAYDGYVGVDKKGAVVMGRPSQADKARGAKEAFDRDIEGMRTAYNTYKKSDDPSAAEVSRRMGAASEDAISRVQRTGRDADNEMARERRRTMGDSPGFADRAPYNRDDSATNKKGDRYGGK